MSEEMKTKQFLLSSKVLCSYETNTTSKLKEFINNYINKLTTTFVQFFLPVIPYSILLQHLRSKFDGCYKKLFFLFHKKLLKLRNG